jgi:hypothetical protein
MFIHGGFQYGIYYIVIWLSKTSPIYIDDVDVLYYSRYFCSMYYMCVDNDGCRWWHKNAWLLLGNFCWLHVYILIIIYKLR